MAILKCKMCGGNLEISEGMTVCECEYCGTTQTVPKAQDDVTSNLFNRANNLRIKSEFDKAQEIYEKIVSSNPHESEAYWGIVLCKYGIEYVEDPATFKKIPTCHRTQLESVQTDVDYKAALENADSVQRSVYENEAAAIDKLQKDILAIVHKEEPFDVFICYKESDENGKRTTDSVIANDIYHQLTQEGFKVFYAAITLEDKLGQEYEPYIFAALNSAKVMLAIGTKPEYFSAVWVKNEWSRYLKLMKSDRSKLLIPCYKDMDAYDLPEEFSHLQAQDMSKIGFISDIIRGIKKVITKNDFKPDGGNNIESAVESISANIGPLLKRTGMFLEDCDWRSANEYAEKVLDMDPECAQAYLYKLMSELHVSDQEELINCQEPFDNMNTYKKVYKFGDDSLKEKLSEYNARIKERIELARKEQIYSELLNQMSSTKNVDDMKKLAEKFAALSGYKDSDEKSKECYDKTIEMTEDIYLRACESSQKGTVNDINKAIELFSMISDWKDSSEQIKLCKEKTIIIQTGERYKTASSISEMKKILNDLKPYKDFKEAKDISEKITDVIKKLQEYDEQEKQLSAKRKELTEQYENMGLFSLNKRSVGREMAELCDQLEEIQRARRKLYSDKTL